MGIKKYSLEEEESDGLRACEPSVQEGVTKRRVDMADVMRQSVTLEDFHKELSGMIYDFYHPQA